MTESPQTARWQHKMDATFPDGAVCHWAGNPATSVYLIERFSVRGMMGLDPVIEMPVNGTEKVMGPWTCSDYEDLPDDMHRFTFAGQQYPLIASSRVPEAAAAGMRWGHDHLVTMAPDGGRATFEGTDG
jgi:hypothetical protein